MMEWNGMGSQPQKMNYNFKWSETEVQSDRIGWCVLVFHQFVCQNSAPIQSITMIGEWIESTCSTSSLWCLSFYVPVSKQTTNKHRRYTRAHVQQSVYLINRNHQLGVLVIYDFVVFIIVIVILIFFWYMLRL